MTRFSWDIRRADYDFTCPRCRYEVHAGDLVAWYSPPAMRAVWVMCQQCARKEIEKALAEKPPGEAESKRPN